MSRTGTVQSVERAVALLLAVARAPEGLADLSRRVGLPISTTARLLATLEHCGAVERDEDGVYGVGPAALTIAASVDPVLSLPSLAQPHLAALATAHDEASGLSIVSGRDLLQVAQVSAPNPVQVSDWTGTRVPLHVGCAGLAVLATWSEAALERYLAGDLQVCTDATIVDPDRIRERVAEVRVAGAIWTEGEYVEGVSSTAAAVLNAAGEAVGAIHVYGPSYRFPAEGSARHISSELLARAEQISVLLGHEPGPDAHTGDTAR
jgi:DNA-binding IclR family transcriptional regulator